MAIAAAYAVVGLTTASQTAPVDMEPELRCCFTKEETLKAFVIGLHFGKDEKSVAELRVRTPTGTVAGFNPVSKRYYPPSAEAVYAGATYGTEIEQLFDPELLRCRARLMVIRALAEGKYRVEVIGTREGTYHLNFYPVGVGHSFARVFYPEGFVGAKAYVPISPGEIHVYVFDGKFDDPLDGRIPPTSPTYFRAMRIQ